MLGKKCIAKYILDAFNVVVFFFKILIIYFYREWKGGRKKEREVLIGCLLHMPQPGTGLATQSCALTGIQQVTLCFAG